MTIPARLWEWDVDLSAALWPLQSAADVLAAPPCSMSPCGVARTAMTVAMTVAIATLLQTAAFATLQATERQSAAAGARASMPVACRPMPVARASMPRVARAPMNDDRHCRLPRAAACGSHQVQDQQHAMTQHHAMTEQPHAMID